MFRKTCMNEIFKDKNNFPILSSFHIWRKSIERNGIMLSVIVRRYWHYSRVVTPTNFCALYYTIHPYAVAVLITKTEILEVRPHKIHEIKNIAKVYLISIWILILLHEKCLHISRHWMNFLVDFCLFTVYLDNLLLSFLFQSLSYQTIFECPFKTNFIVPMIKRQK